MLTAERSALDEARTALADEWHRRDPKTASEVLAFYRDAEGLADDLNAWHAMPGREAWTRMLVHIAQASRAKVIIDLGCGAGHDLHALSQAGLGEELYGIEPNAKLRELAETDDIVVWPSITDASMRPRTDLFVCVDVLEHLPNPEDFLAAALLHAREGALLFEATATHDTGTPLHLKENRGWQPGRWLEEHGWWKVDQAGRVHVWRKDWPQARQTSGLLVCSYRLPSIATTGMKLVEAEAPIWRVAAINGDADIARSRARVVSEWWTGCADDTFLMVDDDIDFDHRDADRAVEYCRNGYDIVCGAYPVHNGSHLALRCLPGAEHFEFFRPGAQPVEIQYAATGFMAVHRKVIDALTKTVPLVTSGDWFYPFFDQFWVEDERADGLLRLSEDWAFCERARRLGFKVWMDPQTRLSHQGRHVPLTIANMGAVFDAINKA